VKHIRILLAEMPEMLSDIVAEVVASEPDFTVIARMAAADDVGAAARRLRADVVMVRHAGDGHDIDYSTLAIAHRPIKVIALAEDGREGFLYELRPHRVPLGEISARGLVAAIRAAAGDAHP
jgi:DNA-binding NarL/FixJ family response regulator